MTRSTIVTVRAFTQILLLSVVDHLDEISVEELQTALDNVEGKKPTQRLLAAIAYKNGLTQTELLSGTAFSAGRSIAGSSDSTPMSRLSRLLLMLIDLGENENFQNKSKKSSKRSSMNLPKKLALTRRRGHRRSSSNISTRPTMSSTQSRAVGDCSRKRD